MKVQDVSSLTYYPALSLQYPDITTTYMNRYSILMHYMIYINILHSFNRCKQVTVLGTVYKVNSCWMMTGRQNVHSCTLPQFGKLYDILIHDLDEGIIFVFILTQTLCFDPNHAAYLIQPIPTSLMSCTYLCQYRQSMSCHHIFNAVPSYCGNYLYIKSKYDLSVYCDYQ